MSELGSEAAVAAAAGHANGRAHACAHVLERKIARGAHLGKSDATGGGEVGEVGESGGVDAADTGLRADAVGECRDA